MSLYLYVLTRPVSSKKSPLFSTKYLADLSSFTAVKALLNGNGIYNSDSLSGRVDMFLILISNAP